MTYSQEWNTAYKNGQGRPKNMESDLAFLFKTHIGKYKGLKFLELGCADGVNAFRILEAEAQYYGIDGNADSIRMAQEKHPNGHFAWGDFTLDNPFKESMDIVFDRAGISHNTTDGIKNTVQIISDSLRQGGLFIGCDWFSVTHSEFDDGDLVEQTDMGRTCTGYQDGQFVGIGNVHFTTEQEIAELFKEFTLIRLIERITRRHHQSVPLPWESPRFNKAPYMSAVFDFVVMKR